MNDFEKRATNYVDRIRLNVLRFHNGPRAERISDACALILKEYELMLKEEEAAQAKAGRIAASAEWAEC